MLHFIENVCSPHSLTCTMDSSGHSYNIYPQLNEPSIDVWSNLKLWFECLEKYHLRRLLGPDDYIFPSVMSTSTYNIQPTQQMSTDFVDSMLKMFTSAVGLSSPKTDLCAYGTHCFRRGGAQHAFMWAPAGQRWTLSRIRWWGGWADGENVSFALCLAKSIINNIHHSITCS